MPEWLAQISAGAIVPDGLAEWAQAHASFDAAWQACPRPDWLVWLASRNHPTEEQQRHIVRKACFLADRKRSNLPQGVLRPTLTDLQLAHEWVDPGGSSVEYLVGDFFNALIVAAVGVVPIVIAVRLHWPTLGVWRRTLYSDLITIPSAVVLTAIAFFILHRIRRANTARRLQQMTYEQARDIAFAGMKRAHAPLTEATLRREADLFRSQWPSA